MAPQKNSCRYPDKLFTERETDPKVLARRQKQIDYGKVTIGYHNYLSATPKNKRTPKQPRTPDKYQVCSRRSWDGQIKLWRLLLHAYDDERNCSADNSVYSEMSEDVTEGSGDCTDESYSNTRINV